MRSCAVHPTFKQQSGLLQRPPYQGGNSMLSRHVRIYRGLAVAILVLPMVLCAQSNEVIAVPVSGAASALGPGQVEVKLTVSRPDGTEGTQYANVTHPTLTVFRPEAGKGNGTAVVVAPGGAFMMLAWDYEGTEVAKWLASKGVTAFVLKYRLLPTPADPKERDQYIMSKIMAHPDDFDEVVHQLDDGRMMAIEDGLAAIRLIRSHAAEYQINPTRIGIMGFSAGGSLTIGVARHYDAASRPDFAAPIYGFDADLNQPLPADVPPLFLAATQADPLVPVASSAKIFLKWTENHHPAELHLYEKGPHGFGFQHLNLPVDGWRDAFAAWMGSRGLLTAAK